MSNYKPEGYHSVTPYIMAVDADNVIAFLEKTFDASVKEMIRTPEGRVGHGEIRIGDSVIMIAEASEKYPFHPSSLYVYVPRVDDTYGKGIAAGGESLREPTDEFYGDRSAGLKDASGNQWWFATHQKTMSNEEMQEKYLEVKQQEKVA